MAICKIGIKARREKARKQAMQASGELDEMKARVKAQIAAMREMMQ